MSSNALIVSLGIMLAPSYVGNVAAERGSNDVIAKGVFAVTDVSESSKCEVVYTTYANPDFTTPIEETPPVPCQGGVILVQIVRGDEANQKGGRNVTYVPQSGNERRDAERIERAKQGIVAKNNAARQETADEKDSVDQRAAARQCATASRSARMTFWVNNFKYQVRHYVYYSGKTDCSWGVDSVAARILTNGGRGVYWRDVEYSNPEWKKGMGCAGIHDERWISKRVDKNIYLGGNFNSETLDSGLCSSFANSYTGNVILR